MAIDERMRERVEAAIKSVSAQYVEVHIEEASSSNIRYRGRDLEEIGRGSALGGSVRALAGGGWGFASFNDLSDLESKVRLAVDQAKVVGGERIELAEVPTVVDHVPARVELDPMGVSLADKKGVLDQYVDIMMGTSLPLACSQISAQVVRPSFSGISISRMTTPGVSSAKACKAATPSAASLTRIP